MFSIEKQNFCSKVWFLCLIIVVPWSSAVVVLENNGYKGLVVAIQKDIPENLQLINNIKHNMLTKASVHLYKVTKNGTYFEEVTIVVPPLWSPSNNYEIVQGGDHFSRAEVRVDRANPMYGDTPYTLQPGQCGERGEYIHFTPQFIIGILNNNSNDQSANNFRYIYGDPERIFVHEWAHFRYGIFDEYVDQTVSKLPKFYLDEGNKIHPTGCSEGVSGWLLNKDGSSCVRGEDGLPTSDCWFFPAMSNAGNNQTKKPSIMYLPGLETADGFCEDDDSNGREHNFMALNKHNIMCQQRSNWDVIFNNPDFKTLNPLTQTINLVPKFRVIQPKKDQASTYVLILDVSYSMQGRRLDLQQSAVSRFIKLHLINSSMVGMVSFSTNAQVLSDMSMVNDQTRADLVARIPTVAGGYTAIGRGILTGIKLLKDNGIATEGALLVLVTDGEENVMPFIDDILTEIIASKVIIITIAFGRQASNKLDKLVTLTGGRAFFFDDDKTSHKLLDAAFFGSATTNVDIERRSIELVNRDIQIIAGSQFQNFFFVDKAVGRNTMFLITYDNQVNFNLVTLEGHYLWSPTGVAFNSTSLEFIIDRNTLTLGFKLTQATAGKWMYKIVNGQTTTTSLNLMVSSESSDIKLQPVRVRAWVSDLNVISSTRVKVYAEVRRSYNAIINATVIGTVGRPFGEAVMINLRDNGAGADTAENDGIYSGYFSSFNGVGRYSVEAVVKNEGSAHIEVASTTTNSKASGLAILNRNLEDSENPKSSFNPFQMKMAKDFKTIGKELEVEQIDDFERYASGGAFRVITYNSLDVIPPSRVTDLKIFYVNFTERKIHLRWTSADDKFVEKGVVTEVRYHQNLTFLLKHFNMSYKYYESENLTNLMVELPSHLQLNESNFRVYFALRSRDLAGNQGDISNWEMVQFPNPTFSFISPVSQGIKWYIILIIVVASIILLSVIVFVVYKIICYTKIIESVSMQVITAKDNTNQA